MLPESELREQFSKRRFRQFLIAAAALAVLVGVISVDVKQRTTLGIDTTVVLIGSIVVLFGLLALTLVNWRCPACGRYIGRTINPKFCSGCGFQFRL